MASSLEITPRETARVEVSHVRVHFQGVRALDDVSLGLGRGEILGLIGPNGAGKTTFVNVLSGFQRPTSGTIRLDARDVTSWSADRRARAGLVRTFQSVRAFGGLTVWDNVAAAAAAGLSRRSGRAWVGTLLGLLRLDHRADVLARGLPAGEERRLGIARALATAPSFLLLDEPAAGLNEAESDDLVEILSTIREQLGCGMLVIEHDMRLIMRLCERLHVLDHGRTIAEGPPATVRSDSAVLEAYLGAEYGQPRA